MSENRTSDSMFDVLMEIRRIDKQISEQKFKVQKSQEELVSLETSIGNVKDLQFKASIILKDMERKAEDSRLQLEDIHKIYDSFIEVLEDKFEIISEDSPHYSDNYIDELRKQRDDLKEKLASAKIEREEIARKLNDVELENSIKKKKNAAKLLRLQKNLDELMQEEQHLLNKLKSTSNI